MHRKWLPLNALRAFAAAGKNFSFTAAANSLTFAQSAVSRHVIVLEKFLGVTLFERRPQQLVLTEAGRHLQPVVSKSFDHPGKWSAQAVFDTSQLAVQYALSGSGIALVDPFLFPDKIAAGRLLQPFDVSVADGYGYYLTTHKEQLDNEAVSLFRSWLISRFAKLDNSAAR